MGFGKALGAVATGGLSLALSKDQLLGKRDPGRAGGFQFADKSLKDVLKEGAAVQKGALKQVGSEIGALKGISAEGLARRTTFKKEQGLRQAAADAARKAEQAVAQRGLGRSAVGLRAKTSPFQSLGEKIGQVRADKDLLKQQIIGKRIGILSGAGASGARGIGSALQGTSFIKPRASKGRSGGLLGAGLGVAGAIGAGASGGDAGGGAQAGMGIGKAFANA